MRAIRRFVIAGVRGNAAGVDLGLLLLRLFVGLALVTVFEKMLPRDGVWGPQQWFVDDVAAMGFPLPRLFAWAAVSAEFFGGLLLMIGFGTRFAALANAVVTGVAAFVYHQGDIGQSGLTAMIFFVICCSLLLAGPGRWSVDGRLARRRR